MDMTLQPLSAFHFTGERVSGDLDDYACHDLRPALFGAYHDLRRLRYDYPLVLIDRENNRGNDGGNDGGNDSNSVRSLSSIVDETLGTVAPHDTSEERVRQSALKLEEAARSLVSSKGARSLREVWGLAEQMLIEKTDLAAREQLSDDLSRVRDGLKIDGEVVDCDHDLPVKFVTHAWKTGQQEQARKLGDKLDGLMLKLRDILKVDFLHSEEAHGADSLRRGMASATGDEFDFDTMSELLRKVPVVDTLPKSRSRRIQVALATMRSQRFVAAELRDSRPGRPKSQYEFEFNTCEEALSAFQERLPEMSKLVKAMAVAELEIDNRYNEAKHDPLFRRFASRQLHKSDFAMFPSYLVCLHDSENAAVDQPAFWQVLSSRLPIKVLVQFDDLLDAKRPAGGRINSQLGAMALGLGSVYVLQSASAHLYRMRDAVTKGLVGGGPALFSVYSGSLQSGTAPAKNNSGVAPYLAAAAATEARVFPGYVYDPLAGKDWASRFHLVANPQSGDDWPIHDFKYEDKDLQRTTVEAAFTFVDFAACDHRLAERFARVPTVSWHDGMVPVSEFMDLGDDASAAKVPYIWMIDEDNALHRAIVEESLIDDARQCRDLWRGLQELTGIKNSHAKALLTKEREIWGREKDLELAAHVARSEADADVKTETRAIAPETAADEPVSMEPTPGNQETVETVIEAAHIDTPRCTTCNECTEINNKMFAYNDEMQAYVADPSAGTFRQMVEAAESCQVAIIHPGKPLNAGEPGLNELVARAGLFN